MSLHPLTVLVLRLLRFPQPLHLSCPAPALPLLPLLL
jgi:hypothetical protein